MTSSREGNEPTCDEQFQQIRQKFIAGLAARESEIAQARTPEALNSALHRLAGAAGSFGFDALSDLARKAMDVSLQKDEAHLLNAIASVRHAISTIRGTG